MNSKIAIAASLIATAAISSYVTRIKQDMKWMEMVMEATKEVQKDRKFRLKD